MNRAELVEILAKRQDMTKADARRVLDTALAAVSEALASGEPVHLAGFGNFDLRFIPARTGAVVGHAYERPARHTVRFRPAKALSANLPVPAR